VTAGDPPTWERATVTERVIFGGLRRTGTPHGLLRVEYTYQAACFIDRRDGTPDLLTEAATYLDGKLITDPARARALTAAQRWKVIRGGGRQPVHR
jgi:hypothetical protein